MTRRLVLLAAGAAAAWVVVPLAVSGVYDFRLALALALAGPAAGAAVAAATGRPLLAAAALSGTGGYVAGILSVHGIAVPAAVLCGAAAGGVAGAAVGAVGRRLDEAGFLVLTLLATIAAAATVQALPAVTGAEAGLGPLPALAIPLGAHRRAELTPVGDFHALLVVAVLSAAVAALLLRRGPGPAWRAVGSDRLRARATGIKPEVADIAALGVAGVLAALSGALAAHVARIATPQDFALDVAALPLLAAFVALREPVTAALVAAGVGVLGQAVLPAAGWQGPPSAMSLAIGILAVVALLTLVPGRRDMGRQDGPAVDFEASWPLDGLRLRGADLATPPLEVRGRRGERILSAPALTLGPGHMLAVVGPNGSGKSTLLREIRDRVPGAILMPQAGGGFAACSAAETLSLAARAGASASPAAELTHTWLRRLGLAAEADRPCRELSDGQRRLLDLARVVLCTPSVLLADEPLSGLDAGQRGAVVSLLRALSAAGVTMVVAEHDREAVAMLPADVMELARPELEPVPAVGPAPA